MRPRRTMRPGTPVDDLPPVVGAMATRGARSTASPGSQRYSARRSSAMLGIFEAVLPGDWMSVSRPSAPAHAADNDAPQRACPLCCSSRPEEDGLGASLDELATARLRGSLEEVTEAVNRGAAPIFAEKEELQCIRVAGFHSFCCLYRVGSYPEVFAGAHLVDRTGATPKSERSKNW